MWHTVTYNNQRKEQFSRKNRKKKLLMMKKTKWSYLKSWRHKHWWVGWSLQQMKSLTRALRKRAQTPHREKNFWNTPIKITFFWARQLWFWKPQLTHCRSNSIFFRTQSAFLNKCSANEITAWEVHPIHLLKHFNWTKLIWENNLTTIKTSWRLTLFLCYVKQEFVL